MKKTMKQAILKGFSTILTNGVGGEGVMIYYVEPALLGTGCFRITLNATIPVSIFTL